MRRDNVVGWNVFLEIMRGSDEVASTGLEEKEELERKWDPVNRTVVLGGHKWTWSKKCIDLSSVVPVDKRLTLFYHAPGDNGPSHLTSVWPGLARLTADDAAD